MSVPCPVYTADNKECLPLVSVSNPVYTEDNKECLPLVSVSNPVYTEDNKECLPLVSVSNPVYTEDNKECLPLVSVSNPVYTEDNKECLPLVSVSNPVYTADNKECLPLVSVSKGCTYLLFVYNASGVGLKGMYISVVCLQCLWCRSQRDVHICCLFTMPLVSVSKGCTYLLFVFNASGVGLKGMYISVVCLQCLWCRSQRDVHICCLFTMPLVSVPKGCTYLLFVYNASGVGLKGMYISVVCLQCLWCRSQRDVHICCLFTMTLS